MNRINKGVKFSIRLKFFIAIISIIIFVSTSIVFSSMLLSKRELENEIEKRGISEAKSLAYDAKYGGFTEDTIILSRLISGRMKKSDIVYVTIEREDGKILAKESKGEYILQINKKMPKVQMEDNVHRLAFISDKGEKIYEFSTPIVMEEQVRPEDSDLFQDILFIDEDEPEEELNAQTKVIVKIGMSLKNMETRMMEILFINVLIIFVVITIAIIIALIFVKKIVTPIRNVAQTAMDISKGDLTKIVEVQSSDEVGVMADNFNRMTTSLKNTIEELEELKDELENKVALRTKDLNYAIMELEKANEDLRKLDEMKTNFISSVSHELRTPLTSIVGFAKLMNSSFKKNIIPRINLADLNDEDNCILKNEIDEAQEEIAIIVSEGDRLARLINEVLDIAKMEAGKVDWNDEMISLIEIIDYAINTSTCILEEKGLEIVFNKEENIPNIYCDKDRVLQVILNLLSNALKFTNQGLITWGLRNTGQFVEVRITDTGTGIDEREISQIFDKFKQVGNTLTDKPTGTGLGLPICKEIIEHYGGKIWVESELGRGTSFTFTLAIRNTAQSFNFNKKDEDEDVNKQKMHGKIA